MSTTALAERPAAPPLATDPLPRPRWARHRFVRVALWTFALGSAGGSLLARVAYRGPYLFGWEILGAAHGQFLLAMEPFWSAVARIEWSSRHCWYWSNQCSLLYTIPPALLGSLYPSQHWAAVVTFALTLATFAIVTRATGLRARDAWLVLLTWGAAFLVTFVTAADAVERDAPTFSTIIGSFRFTD